MTGRLHGRAILVTGGGSGIGRGAAHAYAAEGAAVTVLERSPGHASRLADELGGAATVLTGDATDPGALADAVRAAAGRPGSTAPGLANLTCCVGVFDAYASVRDLAAGDLAAAADQVWRANVLSALLAVNAAYPELRTASGSVTLTLSESAYHPVGGGVLYGSSKWALRGAVAHLARDLAPEVRVNGVAPGGTTGTAFAGPPALGPPRPADRVPGRDDRIRSGNALAVVPEPADHAGAYVYLADPAASRVVTGVVINTDGGRQ